MGTSGKQRHRPRRIVLRHCARAVASKSETISRRLFSTPRIARWKRAFIAIFPCGTGRRWSVVKARKSFRSMSPKLGGIALPKCARSWPPDDPSLRIRDQSAEAQAGRGAVWLGQDHRWLGSRSLDEFTVRPMDRAMNNVRQKDLATFDPEAKAAGRGQDHHRQSHSAHPGG